MTSLPVRKLYQRIGEQIDAQVDAVVHIENSIYLRSKAIDNDSESLKAFLEYSISLLGKYNLKIFSYFIEEIFVNFTRLISYNIMSRKDKVIKNVIYTQ